MNERAFTTLTTCRTAGRIEVRLRFGRPARVRRSRDPGGVTRYWFDVGRLFAVSWWARLSPRRQVACFAVVESLRVGDAGHRVPCVQPAVRVHLFVACRCVGNDRRVADRAEALVRHIERIGLDPCDVRPAYYRAAGLSLRARREPRRLGAAAGAERSGPYAL